MTSNDTTIVALMERLIAEGSQDIGRVMTALMNESWRARSPDRARSISPDLIAVPIPGSARRTGDHCDRSSRKWT